MMVVKVVRSGRFVRFSSQASGRAKKALMKIVPKPTMAVLGMTKVSRRELAMFDQCRNVKPGSVGKPGTKVM
jgi:hypothetical protein